MFSVFAHARMCKVDDVRNTVRKALFSYLKSPGTSRLGLLEIKDIIIFYMGIGEDETTEECSVKGVNTGKNIYVILEKEDNASIDIQRCSDGTVYDRCSNNKPLYCYEGGLLHRCGVCGCPINSLCNISGECIFNATANGNETNTSNETEPEPSNQTCNDTDGGADYYVKGTVTIYTNGVQGSSVSDSCVVMMSQSGGYNNVDSCEGLNCSLIEQYCSSDGIYKVSEFYNCTNGCSDGACLQNATDDEETCTDSDGGRDYYTKGQMEAYGAVFEDFCYTSESLAGTLKEYYCREDGVGTEEKYKCPNNCSDGACIQ